MQCKHLSAFWAGATFICGPKRWISARHQTSAKQSFSSAIHHASFTLASMAALVEEAIRAGRPGRSLAKLLGSGTLDRAERDTRDE
jgi:hypothetical protein